MAADPGGVRVVLHADMDAFYASVEQRDHPELRGRPVIVGGTTTRGVVMAASYEARPFGVRSAMPTVQARALCPDAVFLPGDMAKYRRVSAQIRAIFESISSAVEPLSLDEAFIDVTGSRALLGPPLVIGRLLKDRVRAGTGLAVSVGIGPGKMVAKIASDLAKPDGLLEVPPERVEAFLRPLAVGRLWGVGPVTEATLRQAGITTIGELAARSPGELAGVVGRPAAEHLVRLAGGIDVRAVEPDLGAKSYGEEGTFGEDVRDDPTVRGAIVLHAEAVARRLRRDAVRGRVAVLKIKLAERLGRGKFRLLTRRATLPEATDDGKVLSDAALRLWDLHQPRTAVRLVGVTMAGIEDGREQLALFGDAARVRRVALNRALDRIVGQFGQGIIARGGARVEKGLTTRVKRGE
ncbi:MAG TPA: DNA polymerase IV [Candidatus Binatus sp.]|nr:DNA polymerase IV [Candidatus Binatus sp.]